MCCKHRKVPKGYIAAQEWAMRMLKTHHQRQCPKCGLWAIWSKNKKNAGGDKAPV